jgi:D-alanyl-D-alanine carboxypeptidase
LAIFTQQGDTNVPPPAVAKPKLPQLKGEMLSLDKFSAQSIIVKDQKTGAVLLHKNEYEKRPIASITKLLSALVILEKNPNWSATTTVIGADSLDTHMYAGDTYTLEELWQAALVGSSNKAILTLSNALGWPEEAFVERMNQKALELGMSQASFIDATGLSSEDSASASDVAILLNEALRHDKIRGTLAIKEINLYSAERKQQHHIWNTDWLLLGWVPQTFPEFSGGKTGYIEASGYNFAMQVGDGLGHRINVIILGANTHEARFTEAKEAGEWALANYQWEME